MKTLATFLVIGFLAGGVAYYVNTHGVQWDIEHSPHYSPNVMHKIQLPCPPACNDGEEPTPEGIKVMEQIAQLNRDMPISIVKVASFKAQD